MSHVDSFEVGSIVQIGQARPLDRGMTWRVTALRPDGNGVTYADIRSGGSGQTRTYPITKLTLFRVTEGDSA